MSRLEIKPTKIRLVHEGPFMRFWDDEVVFPSGATGTHVRMRWTAPYGVGVVVTDGAAALLLETHRYGEPRPSWEIPRGFGATGSTPEADARRELWEETGLEASAMTPLFIAGASYEQHIFLARAPDLSAARPQAVEGDENIGDYKQVPLSALRAPDFAALGVIDSVTMTALLLAARRLAP